MIDYDSISDWGPSLKASLCKHLPKGIVGLISQSEPETIDEALKALFQFSDRDAIIDSTISWIENQTFACYHGTRITSVELGLIKKQGLVPLDAETRRHRLLRALSKHPTWGNVSNQLDDVIARFGNGGGAGKRENQVHLTLSRSGLLNGFNHYLQYGSEFDQHVADDLLGLGGKELLRRDGTSMLLSFAIPGTEALNVVHSYFSIEDLRKRGDVPNLVRELLEAWSFWLVDSNFDPSTLKIDCGFVFKEAVPANLLLRAESIPSG